MLRTYALGNARTRASPSLRTFPSTGLDTVSTLIGLQHLYLATFLCPRGRPYTLYSSLRTLPCVGLEAVSTMTGRTTRLSRLLSPGDRYCQSGFRAPSVNEEKRAAVFDKTNREAGAVYQASTRRACRLGLGI